MMTQRFSSVNFHLDRQQLLIMVWQTKPLLPGVAQRQGTGGEGRRVWGGFIWVCFFHASDKHADYYFSVCFFIANKQRFISCPATKTTCCFAPYGACCFLSRRGKVGACEGGGRELAPSASATKMIQMSPPSRRGRRYLLGGVERDEGVDEEVWLSLMRSQGQRSQGERSNVFRKKDTSTKEIKMIENRK